MLPEVENPSNNEESSPFSNAEHFFIAEVVEGMSRAEVLICLKRSLQAVCAVELSAIPMHLFRYYSLSHYSPRSFLSSKARATGQIFAAERQVATNASHFMVSEVIDNMLHTSVAANIYYAITGTSPKLYSRASQDHSISLVRPLNEQLKQAYTRFSDQYLSDFVEINKVTAKTVTTADPVRNKRSLIYSYIRCLLCSSHLSTVDFQVGSAQFQLQPTMSLEEGTGSDLNRETELSTVNRSFNSWSQVGKVNRAAQKHALANYVNGSAGKEKLILITCKVDALMAIDTICEHSESYSSEAETMLAQLTEAGRKYNFPTNPKLVYYPTTFQAIAKFSNALCQYILMVTEVTFESQGHFLNSGVDLTQKHAVNTSLQCSMIWLLDKYIQTTRNIVINSGIYRGKVLAPTFEFVALGTITQSYTSLAKLGHEAIKAATNANVNDIDSSIAKNIEYYINVALTQIKASNAITLPKSTAGSQLTA